MGQTELYVSGKPKGCRTLADFFVAEPQIFCRGQIGLRFVGTSVFRPLADFLTRLATFRFGTELISAMLKKTLAHVILMTIPHWLRHARAPPNCLGPLHSSRQGPTRRFEISPDKPRICRRLRLNSPHTSRRVKIFCRPTKNRLVGSGLNFCVRW